MYMSALHIWVMQVGAVVIGGAVTQCENLAFFDIQGVLGAGVIV